MSNPTVISCPNCFGPMKKDRRVEECGYCGSMVEWYKGPELPREMQEARQRIIASNQWSTMDNLSTCYVSNNWSTHYVNVAKGTQ